MSQYSLFLYYILTFLTDKTLDFSYVNGVNMVHGIDLGLHITALCCNLYVLIYFMNFLNFINYYPGVM